MVQHQIRVGLLSLTRPAIAFICCPTHAPIDVHPATKLKKPNFGLTTPFSKETRQEEEKGSNFFLLLSFVYLLQASSLSLQSPLWVAQLLVRQTSSLSKIKIKIPIHLPHLPIRLTTHFPLHLFPEPFLSQPP